MPTKLVPFLVLVAAWASAASPQAVTFFTTAAVGLAAPPEDVAIADVNGDGIPDLITANNSVGGIAPMGGTVSVLLGTGKGKFAAVQTIAVGPAGLVSLLVADFNRDGKPDLVVSDTAANVFFLKGLGNGTFAAAASIAGNFAVAPGMLLTADFNGDRIPDLAVPIASSPASPANGIAILLGRGDGTFAAAAPLTVNVLAPFAVADFNSDGKSDLAVLAEPNNGVQNAVGIVQIFLGNGDGSFVTGSAVQLASPLTGGGVAAGDLNGDGKADMAVVYTNSALSFTRFSVINGNGDGTFAQGTAVPCDLGPQAPLIADLNGDGKLDVAIPSTLGATVGVYLNQGTGTFSVEYYIVGGSSLAVAAGNLYQNASGLPDLAVANLAGSSVATLQNLQNGVFNGPVSASRVGASIAVADFNGDGNLDVATSSGDILLGTGKGQYTASPVITAYPQGSVLAADVNGDGIPDLVTGYLDLSVALGFGTGAFQAPVISILPAQISGMVAGDFNGDRKADLLAVSSAGGLYFLPGNGNGTFQNAQTVTLGDFTDVVAADFNADGKLDAAAIQFNPGNGSYQVVLYLGNGNGTFQAPVILTTGISAYSLLAQDVNNDGKMDLIVGGSAPGPNPTAVAMLFGVGNGTFHKAALYTTSVGSGAPAVVALTAANFNGSGGLDVAAATANSLLVLLNNGSSTFTIQPQRFAMDGVANIASGFLRAGTLPAILVGNTVSQSVWTMRNTTP